ncbi:MAG TPA: hypothetical protein VF008_04540 [Niastella sp.]
MKLLLSIYIVLLAASSCSAQKTGTQSVPHIPVAQKCFQGDTLQYVQNCIMNHKDRYIGKPLDTLLSELEIPFGSIMNSVPHNNTAIVDHSTCSFYNALTTIGRIGARFPKTVLLSIIWEKPLSSQVAFDLTRESKGNWTAEIKEYFGKQVIKDIILSKYD